MTKEEKIQHYNPSGIGLDNGKLFGLPFEFEESDIIVLPVPWELTASYGEGTSRAPQQILKASSQLDLFHLNYPEAWKQGIFMLDVSDEIYKLNSKYLQKAREIILLQEKGKSVVELDEQITAINQVCDTLRKWVFEQAMRLLNRGKRVILLGGDHSTPLGYMQALAQKYDSFGILQIDAHADLRQAYEGFKFSHASIMFNALKMAQVTSLVQVGVRDICQEEIDLIQADKRIRTYFDVKLHQERYRGVSVSEQWDRVIKDLPERVYVSFDIDGLDPKLCPNTGTPVPGGLQYEEVVELFRRMKESGKEIIGCDLNEVGNQEWDANVGARILYELSCIL